MFRLIAIALTSTFLLLALLGTSSEQAPANHSIRAMGLVGALGTKSRDHLDQAARMQYVSHPRQPLKAAPDPAARVLRILPYGAEVELIDAGQGSFAQVHYPLMGEVGFILADSLSDAHPD